MHNILKYMHTKKSGGEWTAGQMVAAGATVVAGIGLLGNLFGGGEDDSKGGRKSTKRKRDKEVTNCNSSV